MSYVTNDDIETRLGTSTYIQLADDDGDNVADAPVVDEARLGAEGEVNGNLARRYAVPIDLTAHPELTDLLKTITLDLIEFRLRARRPPVPEDAARTCKRARAFLTALAAGTIHLPGATPIAGNTTAGPIATALGEGRRLSLDELDDY